MLSLKFVKQHLNVDQSFKDDDTYIMSLCDVAEQAAINHINSSTGDELYDDEGNYKPTIMQGMLLLIGNLYANREAGNTLTVKEVPYAYDYLMQQNKSYEF